MQTKSFGQRVGYLCLSTMLLWATPVAAADIGPKLAIPVFLKMVSYDDSFSTPRKPDTLHLYFLYDFADSKSYQQYEDAREYFSSAGDLMVSGVPVCLIGIQKGNADSVIKSTPDSIYSVLICAAGRGKDFTDLASTLKAKNLHSFAIDYGDMGAGISASIEAKEHKTTILINLRTALAEGSHFSARLLSMCTILDKPS